MVAAVSNAIGASNVAFRKSLDSISSVVSCKLAKCENECDDEDEHAKYFCCKLNDWKRRGLFPASTRGN